jgi:hypothetical protein
MNDPSEFEFEFDESWQAFRFLADEMSDDERASFEARLANDEVTAESLIECCGLTESVFQAFESDIPAATTVETIRSSPISADAPKRTSVWLSQVACVVAMVCVGVALWSGDSERASRMAQAEVNAELALHWESAAVVVPLDTALVSEFESNDPRPTTEVINEAKAEHVPEWLLVALQSQQDTNPTPEEVKPN